MSPEPIFRQSRRSTRVPLKVLIEVRDGAERLTGETIIVNLHGALITTSTGLNTGMKISVYVYLTDKRASAQVVHVDPENPMRCGIELDNPQNIWGVSLPPDDWGKACTERGSYRTQLFQQPLQCGLELHLSPQFFSLQP